MISTGSHLFCPRCATENKVGQGYCRQCGQALSVIQLVLDGSLGESGKRLEAAEKWIGAGYWTLISFISIAVTIAAIGIAIGNSTLSVIAMINVLAGALIGFPLLCLGDAKLRNAKRLMSKADLDHRPAIQGSSERELPSAQTAELQTSANRGSITEHTTLHLSKSNPAGRD